MRISKIVGNISYLTLKCEIQFRKNINWFDYYRSQLGRLVYIDDKIISDNISIELPYRKETTKINYTKQYKNNNFNRNQLVGYTDEKIIKILKETYLNNYKIDIDDIEIQYDNKILNHTVVKVPSVIKVYTNDDKTIISRKLKIRKNELEN